MRAEGGGCITYPNRLGYNLDFIYMVHYWGFDPHYTWLKAKPSRQPRRSVFGTGYENPTRIYWVEASGTRNIPNPHCMVDELGNDPSWAPSHQLYRLATLLTCLLIRITLVLPPGLAPRLGPNQGLGRYKLPCAAYTTEGNKASHYLVPNLGYEPRPPKRAGFKPAAYTFRQKGSGPSTWNQTMVKRSSGACLIIRRYWNKLCGLSNRGAWGQCFRTPCLLHHTSGHCSGTLPQT